MSGLKLGVEQLLALHTNLRPQFFATSLITEPLASHAQVSILAMHTRDVNFL